MEDDFKHAPVLLEEVLNGLHIHQDGLYIDATFGRGGHSLAILENLAENGRLLVFDKDPEAVALAREIAQRDQRLEVCHSSFSLVSEFIAERSLVGLVDGILLDLGVSSPQLDNAERGFSFLRDGELDMRMNPQQGESARDWLNAARQEDIVKVLREYGEERFAGRIARAIVNQRQELPITHTLQLAELISNAVPRHEKDKHPATRSFQAIRIYVNNELKDLDALLNQVVEVLKPGGRLVVISFHSLEDRIVKRFMRKQSRGDDFPPDLPVTQDQLNPRMKLIGRAIKPADVEVEKNPRARSAVMRIAEKLAA